MKTIPNFKNFDVSETVTAVGFGMGNSPQNFGLGGGTPQTGYSMTPIAGVVESCSNHVAEQAKMYESNDNDDHTAESYMKEAKKHINESMDRAYEGYGSMDEGKNSELLRMDGKDAVFMGGGKHNEKIGQISIESDGSITLVMPKGRIITNVNKNDLRLVEGKSVNEAMVQIKGKDKPSGAKVLAKIIVGEFYDQKKISSREVKEWEQDIAELIMNSTF